MKKEVKAKIFLADERGFNQTPWFSSYNTFNFGQYKQEHKQPAGDLYVLNDDILEGGRYLSMLVEEDSYIALLPVAGAVVYKDSQGNDNLLAAGQLQIAYAAAGTTVEMKNPFADGAVNFLQLWIKADTEKLSATCISTYDVNKFQNSLIKISAQQAGDVSLPFAISIGKFTGRGETVYSVTDNNMAFVFVLAGAFEAEGRLLHDRDGLALWNAGEIEMEALSNDAVILLVELSLK